MATPNLTLNPIARSPGTAAEKLVGIIHTGRAGRDPLDRRVWSSSSYHLFSKLASAGRLHRVLGVELSDLWRYLYMAKNFSPRRAAWRIRFLTDPAYRDALTCKVSSQLKAADFDHDFLQIGAMYDIPALLAGRARCFSYHDGNLAELVHSPCCPRELGSRRIDRGLAYERAIYQGIDRIHTMSEYLRRSFIHHYDVPPDRVVTVGGGINLEEVPTYQPDKRYDSNEVLFIGRDFDRKGGPQLLQAFRAVRERFRSARLHVVGPTTLNIPAGQEGGVVFHGLLKQDSEEGRRRLATLFARCCLFVMPSLYEPFGIAPLEAMAHQIPCLLTNGWALAEMVVPGTSGDLVECGSVEDLAAKMAALLADPESLRRMGEAARSTVLERFTWDRVIYRLIGSISGTERAKRRGHFGARVK